MYKIAIIDDEMNGETNRKKFYEGMFEGAFEVVAYISEPDEMVNAHNLEVHAYILDLVYEDKKYDGLTFDIIVNNINAVKNVPIFLISSKWETFKLPVNAKKLCDLKNVVNCIGWNEFTAQNQSFLLNTIRESISRFFNYTSVIKGENETIKILQLSDLQFGDKDIDESFNCADVRLVDYLNDTDMTPDLLVITGDIAARGQRSEYQTALKWISNFSESMWGKDANWREKIIVVPGNHDVDYKQCMLDHYDIKDNKLIEASSEYTEYQKKAMFNYAEFMTNLTGIDDYIKNYSNLFRVNERFLNWGIRFYEFNTAQSITPYNPRNTEVTAQNYAEMNKCTLRSGQKNVYNILLSHFGPEDMGYRQSETYLLNKWDAMRSFIDTAKVNMYMCGHVHKSEIRQLDEKKSMSDYAHELTVSTASTYSLNSAGRPNDESRGFILIELCRENGVINKVVGHIYDIKGAKVTENKEDYYENDNILY